MAWRLAELFVEIGARTGGVNAVLAGIHSRLLGLGAVGRGLSGILHSTTMGLSGIGGALGAGGIAAIGAGAVAAGAGLGKMAFMAAHLDESLSKLEQTFGSASKGVASGVQEMSDKFGIVQTEILNTASDFGQMLQGAGIARQKSAEMSSALVKLAVDLKSFFDLPSLNEALIRLQSGLAGETEAVRRWGINLTEQNIKVKAMAMGLNDGKKEMDQATKTMVRYRIILESTKAAQGDWERSQGRLIGQWELFTGRLTKLATAIGTEVTPVLTGLLTVVNRLLGALSSPGGASAGWWLKLLPKWLQPLAALAASTGAGGAADAKAAREQAQADIDRRIDETNAAFLADQEAAQKMGAKAHEKKGFQGGLEEYIRHVQEAAFGKDKHAAKQTALLQQAAGALTSIDNKLTKPAQPGALGVAIT